MNYISPSLILVCSLVCPLAIESISQPVRAHHTPSHVGTVSRAHPRDRVKLRNNSKHQHKSIHRSQYPTKTVK
jgi:hypothetical protein